MLGFSYLSADLSFANTGSTALFPYKMRLGCHYLHAVEYCSSLLYWPLTISDTEYFGKELVMEGRGREAVLRAYEELKLTHPELPSQLHNFQVACTSLWRFFGHNFCFCRLTF